MFHNDNTKSFNLDRMQEVVNVPLLFQDYFKTKYPYTSSCQDLHHRLKSFPAGESMDDIIHFNKTPATLSYNNLRMKEPSICPSNFQLQERPLRTNGESQRF